MYFKEIKKISSRNRIITNKIYTIENKRKRNSDNTKENNKRMKMVRKYYKLEKSEVKSQSLDN